MWLLQPKFIQIEINVGESVEKKEISYTVVGNVKQYSHYGKQYWRLLKKLNVELLYDPEIPCTPMFITALFTIAKTWKQPKCSSTDEWIEKMWYTHTHAHTHTMEY